MRDATADQRTRASLFADAHMQPTCKLHCKLPLRSHAVGEAYHTYPPRGHGNELGKSATYDMELAEGQLYAD